MTIDWEEGLMEWIDPEMRHNAKITAEYIQSIVYELNNYGEYEFIGHGVGAHVAGMGMQWFQST